MISTDSATAIEAREVTIGYGFDPVLCGVDLSVSRGNVTAVIGPNGCGKSTLLKGLCRLLPLKTGHVLLDGHDIQTLRRKSLARRIGFLPQSPIAPEGLLVSDLVARGRHPHQSWYRQWSPDDEREVAKALEVTRVLDLADRRLETLSGGQRQRVWLAMVLAQNTEVLFLDEPTTYLDLTHAIEMLDLVRQLRLKHHRTVVVVLHDLNLAIRYADELVVLREGAVVATGAPKAVISPQLLKEVFGLTAMVVEDPATGGPLVVPGPPQTI